MECVKEKEPSTPKGNHNDGLASAGFPRDQAVVNPKIRLVGSSAEKTTLKAACA
jgi:hypothetical protein